MNEKILKEHIDIYLKRIEGTTGSNDIDERKKRKEYYQSFTSEKVINMPREIFYDYIGNLWAMIMWGDKKNRIDQIIDDNGFDKLKNKISYLLYDPEAIDIKWDNFNKEIKGFGPAMMSELLCLVHPHEYMLWNKTATTAFRVLEVDSVPNHNYQLTGKKYVELTQIAKDINSRFINRGWTDADLLFVDYFFWDQLKGTTTIVADTKEEKETVVNNKSYHSEIIEYIKTIGTLLGYNSIKGNIKDSGKIADAVWEFNVGNIGKIKYVFEVQDSGSIDSLIVSLMNASQDTSVQAVVAVSDNVQIEKIKQHCNNIMGSFNNKLKYWDITEVERAYTELSSSMEIINRAINTDSKENQL